MSITRLNKSLTGLNEYQDATGEFATYDRGSLFGLLYNALQLSAESGEFNGHIAKAIRDEKGHLSDERLALMKKELGDILWSVAQAAYECNWTLEDIANTNIQKLTDRKNRNTLAGYGDNR